MLKHKLIISSIFIIAMLFLSSCSLGGSRIGMLNSENEGKIADARFKQVIEAIKNKDKLAIKSMFSKQALGEAENINGNIDYLLGFIQGKIKSWKNDTWSSDGSINDGKTEMTEIKSWYKVTTDKNEYLFFLLEYTKDTGNPDNVGVYALRSIKAKDKDTQFTYWQDMKIAGIYKPKDKENTGSTPSTTP